MDAGTAPLPSHVLDSWGCDNRRTCPRCGVKGVYSSGRSHICAAGVHQWNEEPKPPAKKAAKPKRKMPWSKRS